MEVYGIFTQLKSDIKKYLPRWFLFTRDFFKAGIRGKLPIQTKNIIHAFLTGFYPNSYVAYNLRENDHTEYLSSHRSARNKYINGQIGAVLSDKLVFERLMKDIINIPQNYSWISRGNLIALEKKCNLGSVARILEQCKRNNSKLVLKPLAGSGGQGVIILGVHEGTITINQDEISKERLNDLVSDLNDYIVTEFVEQGDYISKVFPSSINTIRILTLVDPTTHEPFIARAVHRIGTNKSAPTDNMSRGGLFAPINLETGVLGSAAQ